MTTLSSGLSFSLPFLLHLFFFSIFISYFLSDTICFLTPRLLAYIWILFEYLSLPLFVYLPVNNLASWSIFSSWISFLVSMTFYFWFVSHCIITFYLLTCFLIFHDHLNRALFVYYSMWNPFSGWWFLLVNCSFPSFLSLPYFPLPTLMIMTLIISWYLLL